MHATVSSVLRTVQYSSVSVSFRAYIANRVTDKLTKIHDRIYCCRSVIPSQVRDWICNFWTSYLTLQMCFRSGSAADTQAIAEVVNYQLGFHRCVPVTRLQCVSSLTTSLPVIGVHLFSFTFLQHRTWWAPPGGDSSQSLQSKLLPLQRRIECRDTGGRMGQEEGGAGKHKHWTRSRFSSSCTSLPWL